MSLSVAHTRNICAPYYTHVPCDATMLDINGRILDSTAHHTEGPTCRELHVVTRRHTLGVRAHAIAGIS